jgi:signal transduction histidine kinase
MVQHWSTVRLSAEDGRTGEERPVGDRRRSAMTERPEASPFEGHGPASPDPYVPGSLADLRRTEGRIAIARWLATPWAFLLVMVYHEQPYPPGVRLQALLLACALPLGNVAILYARRRVRTMASARALAIAALSLDVVVASGFVWLYAFDPVSALWAVLFLLPLEGGARFGLPGALGTWAAVTVLYVSREAWASNRYGFPFQLDSISFRMGILFLISLVGGLTSRDLNRQRTRLAGALAELRRVDRLRSGLVSTLAHDVRNPLAAIRASLSTLLRRRDRMKPEQVAELLSRTDVQAERLERLAVGLLELARLEQGRLPLDLGDVPLRVAVERAISYSDGSERFEVAIDPSLTVRADPERLEQVVVNLVSNALAYGAPPFLVRAIPVGNRVAVEFVDHGDGVPANQLDDLFAPFGTRTERGSVGLGLAIVNALVGAHGGTVAYQPNQPRGALFRIGLPAGPRIEAPPHSELAAPSSELPVARRASA